MKKKLFSFTVWPRFGNAYRNAIASLRNSRRDNIIAREERHRLFGVKRQAGSHDGSSKRRKLITWTQKFLCLACTDSVRVPHAVHKCLLEVAGLGERKIVIPDIDYCLTEFNEEIIKAFPKLAGAGGFEFLRCVPNTRDLELIEYDESTTPRLLKQKIGNGKLYIRPIQKDLSMESEVSKEAPEKVCGGVLLITLRWLPVGGLI